jgi:hypothetical protein
MLTARFAFLCACCISLLLLACQSDGRRNIRDYYFPAEPLYTGLVYEYNTQQNGQSGTDYWYYRMFERDSGLFLGVTYYDQQFVIRQIVREKLVDNGSLARDYFLYEPDTASGQLLRVQGQIESPNLFPFSVKDSAGIFLFRLRYHAATDTSNINYVIRNRSFLGDGPAFELKGKKYPTIRFRLREVVGNEREGSWEAEGIGEEWYARDLGLVYSRKSFNKGQIVLESRLRDTYPMSTLEAKAGKAFGQ